MLCNNGIYRLCIYAVGMKAYTLYQLRHVQEVLQVKPQDWIFFAPQTVLFLVYQITIFTLLHLQTALGDIRVCVY